MPRGDYAHARQLLCPCSMTRDVIAMRNTCEPQISNCFPHEDVSVRELNMYLEPEDSKELVLKKKLCLLFPVYFWTQGHRPIDPLNGQRNHRKEAGLEKTEAQCPLS
ncbi:hypothetical protein JEQ12_016995 [Ovis aries]|uniref:Uncharacterized protein n=1 Tax=Ovis aries TaxID=9940 RepID=A0A836AG36_SHEEP|nr:hypothetical protein JEQ12_016995 [Ovis aries]